MRLQPFLVVPSLPDELQGLEELAYNLLWTWDEELRSVFVRLDRELWARCGQNPVRLLGTISQQRLEERARDEGFVAAYGRALERLREYLEGPTWWDKRYAERPLVAYFCAEYGISECLPIYSGGLGVLAGHHLKSASDLGVPLVGVGLLYQQGYFRQYLSSDGWQQEAYPVNDFFNLPVRPATDASGGQVQVSVEIDGVPCTAAVWRAQVGRVPLYLLDTNVPPNPPELRDITDQLYGGDEETRIRQELVLGIGGLRALAALGLDPAVCHMNEGHSAFLGLERVRQLMRREGLSFAEALEAARAGSVFTTHTPVPAGFDVFPAQLAARHLGAVAQGLGVDVQLLLALGRHDGADQEPFSMAALALRTSVLANGVSELHGAVSRSLLRSYFGLLPEHEVPIAHVTNGVHTRSCVSADMAGLFDRYLGSRWWRHPGLPETWDAVDSIPDEELWATHERRRERLVSFARRRLERQLLSRGASRRDAERARGVLQGRALTIGFARRFATYKRADLLLRDLERLRRILLDQERPVQVIFAGKAHPRDGGGKEMLKAVVALCSSEDFRRNAVFLEDYDLEVARYLVQGVDVWLNTPRRGLEASGTSGMKVLPNGGLNVSVLDGWWVEGYEPECGWAIGRGEDYDDPEEQDAVEAAALYDLLEKDVVPLFYARAADGLPRAWIARMKRSMRRLTPTFSTNRMLWEYAERFYLPAAAHAAALAEDGFVNARALAAWRSGLGTSWSSVRIDGVEAADGTLRVGQALEVQAAVRVGDLDPDGVLVEVCCGPLEPDGRLDHADALPMSSRGRREDGVCLFAGHALPTQTGRSAFTVRVRPWHPHAWGLTSATQLLWWE